MKKEKIFYYENFNENFVESKNQNYKLPENYRWVNDGIIWKITSSILYFFAYLFSFIYFKLFVRVKIVNKNILKDYKNQGYFIYANHTQILGDVFVPAIICSPKRIYTIASPSNLGIPIIGKLLPKLGILPIPDNLSNMKTFIKGIETRVKGKNSIIIYPEAHLWPYYTKIRPFENTSFKFPVDTNSVSFCATTTYSKRKIFNKPKMTIYIDGPFLIDENLNKKENQERLYEQIYETMVNRSKNSNYEYIKYEKR